MSKQLLVCRSVALGLCQAPQESLCVRQSVPMLEGWDQYSSGESWISSNLVLLPTNEKASTTTSVHTSKSRIFFIDELVEFDEIGQKTRQPRSAVSRIL